MLDMETALVTGGAGFTSEARKQKSKDKLDQF